MGLDPVASYRELGYAVLSGAMDPELARALCWAAYGSYAVEPKALWLERSGASSGGGVSHYFTLDGPATAQVIPELTGWYDGIRHLVAQVSGEPELVCSPYERSAVNVKVYPPRLGCQGWHYDSNPVSALLYLSDGGSVTEMVDLKGDPAWSPCRAGSLLVMQGRRVFHRVPPNETDTLRVTVPMNYYLPWDLDRPAWVDRAIYENMPPEAAYQGGDPHV